ncbi:hypothetical protein MCEMSE15_00339 [Fimbriimonadaceae bacterium]
MRLPLLTKVVALLGLGVITALSTVGFLALFGKYFRPPERPTVSFTGKCKQVVLQYRSDWKFDPRECSIQSPKSEAKVIISTTFQRSRTSFLRQTNLEFGNPSVYYRGNEIRLIVTTEFGAEFRIWSNGIAVYGRVNHPSYKHSNGDASDRVISWHLARILGANTRMLVLRNPR